MACCNDSCCSAAAPSGGPGMAARLVVRALLVNAGFFVAEIVAGVAAGSAALQADALDFLGDAANHGLSRGRGRIGAGVARPCRGPSKAAR